MQWHEKVKFSKKTKQNVCPPRHLRRQIQRPNGWLESTPELIRGSHPSCIKSPLFTVRDERWTEFLSHAQQTLGSPDFSVCRSGGLLGGGLGGTLREQLILDCVITLAERVEERALTRCPYGYNPGWEKKEEREEGNEETCLMAGNGFVVGERWMHCSIGDLESEWAWARRKRSMEGIGTRSEGASMWRRARAGGSSCYAIYISSNVSEVLDQAKLD